MKPEVIKSEVDLCRAGIKWLIDQHWDVYQEVEPFAGGQRADIVAVRGRCVWVIEAKMSLSLALVEQAIGWKHYAHYVSVLIPQRDRIRGRKLLATLGIGCIMVETKPSFSGDYYIHCDHTPFYRVADHFRDRILDVLTPMQQSGKFGEAGNPNSKRWTPYRNTMDQVRRYLSQHGPSPLKDVLAEISHHYADASALSSMRSALEKWEDWVCVDRSVRPYLYSVRGVYTPKEY